MTVLCHYSALEKMILSALRQAVADDQLGVAEHLLSALEVLQPDCVPGSPLADAYLSIATGRKTLRS
jgi:hypothetical protein